ncbi:hypothetical protein IWQ61_002881 [Dispira simplex]|nr:hypothetical protein IWQ61_002881 [Dispira simplex]
MSLQHRDLTHVQHGRNKKSACNTPSPSSGGTAQSSSSTASSVPSGRLATNPRPLHVASQGITPLVGTSEISWLSFLRGNTDHN